MCCAVQMQAQPPQSYFYPTLGQALQGHGLGLPGEQVRPMQAAGGQPKREQLVCSRSNCATHLSRSHHTPTHTPVTLCELQAGVTACGLRTDGYAELSAAGPLPPLRSFTFLRLGPELLQPACTTQWMRFMSCMQQGGYLASPH